MSSAAATGGSAAAPARPLREHAIAIAASLLRQPPAALILDFDGTLTPIVDDPDRVWLDSHLAAILRRLALRPELRVAVLTGRSIADVRERLGVVGVTLVGNHGFELEGWTAPEAQSSRRALEMFLATLAGTTDLPHPFSLEDKGPTATVHLRGTRGEADRDRLLRALQARLDRDRGSSALLRLLPGKASVEIRPNVAWDKASALRHVLESWTIAPEHTFYAGDDVTDECVFEDLAEGVTVKVGEGSSLARYRAADPAELWSFLRELSRRLSR